MIDLHLNKYAEIERLINAGAKTFLLVGDQGVGKKTLVKRILTDKFPDYLLTEFTRFGIEEARSLKSRTLRRSIQVRAFLIDGDAATQQAYNASLKILEEPPAQTIFFICSSVMPLSTIVSRCHNIMISPLSDVELRAALIYKGMSERAISSLLSYSHGSISEAFKVYEKLEEKKRLIPFIKALKDKDLMFILTQVKTIDRRDVQLLVELIDDVILARYGLLAPELATSVPVSPDFLMQVKEALLSGSSPSLALLRSHFVNSK